MKVAGFILTGWVPIRKSADPEPILLEQLPCNALGEANSLITLHHENLSLGASSKKRLQTYRELCLAFVDTLPLDASPCRPQQGVVWATAFGRVVEKHLDKRYNFGQEDGQEKGRHNS